MLRPSTLRSSDTINGCQSLIGAQDTIVTLSWRRLINQRTHMSGPVGISSQVAIETAGIFGFPATEAFGEAMANILMRGLLWSVERLAVDVHLVSQVLAFVHVPNELRRMGCTGLLQNALHRSARNEMHITSCTKLQGKSCTKCAAQSCTD